MSRSYQHWPDIESIIADYRAGVGLCKLERAYRRNHRQIQDLLYDRGFLRRTCIRVAKPKPAGAGLSLLASCLAMRRKAGLTHETPEQMERLIEAVRHYMGGQVSDGTGEYERTQTGGIERVNELPSRAQVASG